MTVGMPYSMKDTTPAEHLEIGKVARSPPR
jgi:hypothetical protein